MLSDLIIIYLVIAHAHKLHSNYHTTMIMNKILFSQYKLKIKVWLAYMPHNFHQFSTQMKPLNENSKLCEVFLMTLQL